MNLKLKIILFIIGPVVFGLVGVVIYLSYFQYKPNIRHEILQRIEYQVDSRKTEISQLLANRIPYSNFRQTVLPILKANEEVEYVRLYRSHGKGWAQIFGIIVRDRAIYKKSKGEMAQEEHIMVLNEMRGKWVPVPVINPTSYSSKTNTEVKTNRQIGCRFNMLSILSNEQRIWDQATNTLAGLIQKTEKMRADIAPSALKPIPEPPLDNETAMIVRSLLQRTNSYFRGDHRDFLYIFWEDGLLKQVRIELILTMRTHLNKICANLNPLLKKNERKDVFYWKLKQMKTVKQNLTDVCGLFYYINHTLLGKVKVLQQDGILLYPQSDVIGLKTGLKNIVRVVSVVRTIEGFPTARIEVGVSDNKITKRLSPIVWNGMISASIFLGFAITIGLILALYLIYPIRILEKGSLEIRRNRSARIKMKRKDEFGVLAQTLNSLSDDLTEELRKYEMLYAEATEDQLTKLMVRRYFMDILGKEISDAGREHRSTSLLMTDIDHFKKFNDTYGHQTGDKVLAAVAAVIRKNLRQSGIKSDIAGRYGGEEFCVLLPLAKKADAMEVAERIRKNIEGMTLVSDKGEQLKVTLSIGVCTSLDSRIKPEELIEKADKALYASKENGRNRVTFWEPEKT